MYRVQLIIIAVTTVKYAKNIIIEKASSPRKHFIENSAIAFLQFGGQQTFQTSSNITWLKEPFLRQCHIIRISQSSLSTQTLATPANKDNELSELIKTASVNSIISHVVVSEQGNILSGWHVIFISILVPLELCSAFRCTVLIDYVM